MLSERNTSGFNITEKDGKPQGKGSPQFVPWAAISAFFNVFGKSLLLDTHTNGHFHSGYQNFS